VNRKTSWLTAIILSIFVFSCHKNQLPNTSKKGPVPPKYELRAVWVATVDNIDWPSKRDLTPDQQRAEFRQITDIHKKNGINAVFVQVRAAADAFYAQSAEPWSEWLTGKQGKAPDPFYDPTEFMIEECHSKGIEFHAWLNLNRAAHRASKSIAPENISKKHPEWILDYDGYKLFNFGLPEVRDYITEITVNIVKNYDVDGIHFDDYFYPYTVTGQVLKDEAAYQLYGQRFTNKDDWRRNNIDLLIKQISDAISAQKPYVKFGISPFGVWRNKKDDPTGSDTEAGQTSYDNLYADTKKWLRAGWIDYMLPQIYFSTEFDKVPFKTLTNWWLGHTYNRHLYIGQGAYRVGTQDRDKTWQNPSELSKQMRFIRQFSAIGGSVFFSSKSLINNKLGLADSLRQQFYQYPALPPPMSWKDNTPPLPPSNLTAKRLMQGIEVSWDKPNAARDGDLARQYIVHRFLKGETIDLKDPRSIIAITKEQQLIDKIIVKGRTYIYVVTALDRLNNESSDAKAELRY
jgi:uncharacterized lipoprotein YddW (UPF0748 family)